MLRGHLLVGRVAPAPPALAIILYYSIVYIVYNKHLSIIQYNIIRVILYSMLGTRKLPRCPLSVGRGLCADSEIFPVEPR